jgi:hypothetical protein
MFERIGKGWALAKESWTVLKFDPELLVFPAVSGVACLLVLASFAVPLWFTGYIEVLSNNEDAFRDPLAWVIGFAFYFVNYFVIVFFNSALVACAVIRFRGGDPTLADGFRAAMSRLPQIAGWAAVSATVGIILKAIESRSEKLGQIVVGLLGTAWSIATYFVVPVLVVEKLGPVDAAKRSVAILKKAWGESIVANFGIGLFVFLATLPGIALIVIGAFVAATKTAALGIALIVLGVVWTLLVSLISSTLNTIIIAALYLYAADGETPQHFDGGLLRDAFAHKR